MAEKRSEAAERILRVAMRLFAEQGYERTSIADIQRAAGLAAGSGALYKHFPSKEAVLRAGIEDFVDAADRGREAIPRLPDDPREALEAMARLALELLARDREVLKIAWRELDAFPELREMIRERRIQATYRMVAEWLAERAGRGLLRVEDPEASAAVLVGSLSFFRVFETLLGATPNQVSEERFVRAWVDHFLRALAEPRGA